MWNRLVTHRAQVKKWKNNGNNKEGWCSTAIKKYRRKTRGINVNCAPGNDNNDDTIDVIIDGKGGNENSEQENTRRREKREVSPSSSLGSG